MACRPFAPAPVAARLGMSTRSAADEATRASLRRRMRRRWVSDIFVVPPGQHDLARCLEVPDDLHDGALSGLDLGDPHRAERVDLLAEVLGRPLRHVADEAGPDVFA